jgi:hypothetical protein
MLQGTKSFKDVAKGVWDTVKQQFFDLVAQMISKWTIGFVGKILGAGGGLLDSIMSPFKKAAGALTGAESGAGEGGIFGKQAGSFLGGIGKMVGPLGIGLLVGKMIGFENIAKTFKAVWQGISDVVVGIIDNIAMQIEAIGELGKVVFEGLGKVAESAFGAVSDIIGGLGKAVGGLLAGIGGLFKKKKTPELERLQKIQELLSQIVGHITIDFRDRQFNWMLDKQQQMVNHLEAIRAILNNRFNASMRGLLDRMQRTADNVVGNRQNTGHILNHTKRYLKEIADNTFDTIRAIKKISSAQAGGVFKEPELVMTHGTASNPEYILREDQLMKLGGGGREVNIHNHVHMNGTMISDRDYTRNRLIPEMLNALDVNYNKQRLMNLLGI